MFGLKLRDEIRRSREIVNGFLSDVQRQAVEAAIAAAETKTSCEIVVLVAANSKLTRDPYSDKLVWSPKGLTTQQRQRCRAIEEFIRLGISDTEGQTGVLLVVFAEERHVEVIADAAVDSQVDNGFWQQVADTVANRSKEGFPEKGLSEAVGMIADELAKRFPRQPDDINELSNTIRE